MVKGCYVRLRESVEDWIPSIVSYGKLLTAILWKGPKEITDFLLFWAQSGIFITKNNNKYHKM